MFENRKFTVKGRLFSYNLAYKIEEKLEFFMVAIRR